MGKQKKPSNQKEQKPPYNTFLRYTGLGLQMVITLGLAGALGYWLDRSLNFQFPIFLLTFILLALIGTLYLLIKNLQD